MHDRNSGFRNGLLLYAAIAAAAVYFWPTIKQYIGPDMTPYGMDRGGYDRPDLRRGPPNNHSGITPWDPFHLRDRIFGMRLDEREVSKHIEDRRGEHPGGDLSQLGPQWREASGDGGPGTPRGLACWDSIERRPVPLEFCDRERGRHR